MVCSMLRDGSVSRQRKISRNTVLWRGFTILTVLMASLGVANASPYQFLAPSQTDLNRVYKINRITGEVGACEFELDKTAPNSAANIGSTLCFAEGPGAGAQPPSDYRLIRSHDAADGGVFRVDLRSGAVSVCYVIKDRVVCTAAAK